MAGVPMDPLFLERMEVCSLSDKALRIHLNAIFYAERFDMWMLPFEITAWLRHREHGRRRHIEELLENELWIRWDNAYQIRRWHRPTQAARPYIPKSVRLAVYERDGHACGICGTSERLTLDHIHPFSDGGSDQPSNLRTLCHSCNSRRGAGRVSDEELRRGR